MPVFPVLLCVIQHTALGLSQQQVCLQMQALSHWSQYYETEQTSLLYKIIKLLVGHYSNVKTDQYSLAVEVQCPGKRH